MSDRVCHVQSLRTAFTPAHIQLCCDGLYLALPVTRTTVGVWSLQDITCKPLELEGHSKILTSLSLGQGFDPKYLVSAADDYVILWNLVQARQQLERGGKIRGRVIGTTLGRIQYTSFSPKNNLVAVCTGFYIVVLLTQRENVVATLEGHNGTVTCAEFCPHYTATLVSISEDRTYKVWNLEDYSLVYQSPIITASPFLSLTMSYQQPHVAIGSADGLVRIYDLTDGNGFRCLHQLDVGKVIAKEKEIKRSIQTEIGKVSGPVTVSSRPSWKQAEQTSQAPEDPQDDVETGATVLGLHFMYQPLQERQASTLSNTPAFLQNNNSIVRDLLKSSPMVLVGTTSGLVQVNAKTMEICGFIDFQDPMVSSSNLGLDEQMKTLNAAGSVIFGQGQKPDQMWCIVGSPFQNVVHVLQWTVSAGTQQSRRESGARRMSGAGRQRVSGQGDKLGIGSGTGRQRTSGQGDSLGIGSLSLDRLSTSTLDSGGGGITVLSSDPLQDDSPLKAEFTVKQDKEKDRKPRDFVTSQQKGKTIGNQPLTFKTKIKSSGYSATPRMTMFKPKTNVSSAQTSQSATRRGSRSSLTSPQQEPLVKEYPMKGAAPTQYQRTVLVAEKETAVSCIRVTDDGSSLACALANKSAQSLNLPLTGKCGTSYIGHNHVVNHVDWSHCGSHLLTSSDDRTAAVWVKGQSEPVLKFKGVQRSVSTDGSKNFLNPLFSREVRCGQFYYVDKFILLVSTNNMYLYKYQIDLSKNDVQRYLSRCKYKLVKEWSVDAQQITALSALNSFFSYIVLCACSNKCVEVYDMNVGKRIRLMSDTHARPVHAVCLNEGSPYVSHPPNAYDLFATAAAGDCIKLWDLRTNRCVRRYEGHLNRVYPCGVALSPCGRFIATGAEDKSAYIFDIRSGTYSHKLTGHTDVVADVDFHPLTPKLYTASLDGKIQMYSSK